MHNDSLTKPVLVLANSSVCTVCHNGSYPVVTGIKQLHNGSVNCTECHLSVKQDIHGVKYLQQDDTFNTSNSSAVDCVRCHNNNTALNNISMTRPLVADDNGSMFTHSDNASNGTRWNTTAYWTTTNEACEYCHSDTKHSTTATGLIETIRYGQTLNTTLTSDDIWCGGCHVQTATNYNGTQWTPIPPTIVTNNTGNNTTWDGTGQVWYNHSFMSTFNDTDCQPCHGSLLSATPTTKEFAHKVAVGGFGADCISCHDIGGSTPKINVTALNNSLSLHQNIQNYTEIGNPYSGVSDTNKICWACHVNDSTYPATLGTHADRLGDFNSVAVYTCEDCHISSEPTNLTGKAPDVFEHFYSGEELKAGNSSSNMSSCVVCHNLTEMKLLSSGPVGADAPTNDTYLISHYGKKRTDLRTWSGGVNCSYCHQAGSAFNSTSIMVNPTFNASVPEHSLNA
ncbi:MAG: hypothetical protein M8353_12220, partial [ANME-2 cluster archaeon]|nr:hypothetical protein [ANME-2 cluster archaeon]